ncbi:40S ribosomal protein S15 [Camelus dromedarius]|uniref:40S ribosomal protein S15 n=1 Tax=Camelus dromedarius TaxID=9838 RepID=A0A5N4C130_CAMDR|nr:40S ribosomal protein S15 [Camelus dromedarius]
MRARYFEGSLAKGVGVGGKESGERRGRSSRLDPDNTRKPHSLQTRLREAKKNVRRVEKPEALKTHMRNTIILPETVGSVVGVFNGETFPSRVLSPLQVCEALPAGFGATHSSRFLSLK